jgi:multimeric flavodoxin WrbA
MKVVAFNGSPRTDGNTAILIGHVLRELEAEGISTEVVQVGGEPIRGCTACRACHTSGTQRCINDDDIVNECIAKMVEADGIVLGSPVYFADVTTEMKALIDRAGYVSRGNGDLFRRKVGAAVIAVRRGGAIHAFDTINHFFLLGQMIVPGSSYWNFAFGREKGEVEQDVEGIQTMKTLGQNMAWLLKRLNAAS